MSNKCHCKNWACHSPNSSENKTIMITFTTLTTDLKEKNCIEKTANPILKYTLEFPEM